MTDYTSLPEKQHQASASCTILPFDHGSSRAEGMVTVSQPIPDGLSFGLGTYCKENKIQQSTCLAAIWVLILKCYAGGDGVVFETNLGSFAKPSVHDLDVQDLHAKRRTMQVVHVDAADHETFPEVCECLINTTFEDTPAQAELCYRYNTSFEVVTGVKHADTQEAKPLRQVLETDQSLCQHTDIRAAVYLSGSDPYISITSRARVFSSSSASHIANTYCHLLTTATSKPRLSLRDIFSPSPFDIATIAKWNATPPITYETTIPERIHERTCSHPNKPAVNSWDGDLTYSELDILASALGHHLTTLGVGPGCMVPFCFEKSLWAVVVTYAVLKAGAAFVPLDPSYPQTRLEEIIRTCEAEIVLLSSECSRLLDGLGKKTLVVSAAYLQRLLPLQDPHYCAAIHPCDAAFVLFTSGSTGKPKGVVQEHASVCTVSKAYCDVLHLHEDSRVFQFASYVFDVSTVDIFATLINGGCICIPSEWARRNDTIKSMNDMRVTWADLTPSLVNVLKPEEVTTLETLVLAGEEVKRELVNQWKSKVRLINCYGPAEAGGATALEYSQVVENDLLDNAIGKQLPSACCWVTAADDASRLVPVGSVGELLISGPALGRGYLHDDQQTQDTFVETIFEGSSTDTVRRLYRTGDFVRQLTDGSFVFMGRRDDMVKVRGQKVELGEIETCIARHPRVTKVVALFDKSVCRVGQVLAIVELKQVHCKHLMTHDDTSNSSEMAGAISSIYDWAAEQLPNYMVPARIYHMERIPLSTSQKVDRRAILAWVKKQMDSNIDQAIIDAEKWPILQESDGVARDLQSQILSMLLEAGSCHAATLSDRDFRLAALGLDSIRAVTLSKWIEKRFAVKIGVDNLVDPRTTTSTLSALIERGAEPPDYNATTSSEALLDKVELLWTRLQHSMTNILQAATRPQQVRNVFLTGATGYLGVNILAQLLTNPAYERVIALVRAPTVEVGLQRIHDAVRAMPLDYTHEHLFKLEVWCGDLSKPSLGLHDSAWSRLKGDDANGPENCVHSIIHNGAVVQWNANYSCLAETNVSSTVQLLELACTSRTLRHFAYISGGQRLTFDDQDLEQQVAQKVAASHGYAQTKLVSEILVTRFASDQRVYGSSLRVSVIKPSYIIGSPDQGYANTGDYLWRLAASAVEIRAYNEDDQDAQLFVSDVDTVARTVVGTIGGLATSSCLIKVMDGITMREFWEVVQLVVGYNMRPVPSVVWWQMLRQRVEAVGEMHCLWPLSHILDQERGALGSELGVSAGKLTCSSTERMRVAIMGNLKYLQGIGFVAKSII